MSTPPRQTRWCKWSCSGPALREEPAPRRSEKFWVSMVEGNMSVCRSWDTHRGPRGVTNANVFRFAAYNYQSEANWFHSCVSCVYNIPSFVVFTLFLFLFGLYPIYYILLARPTCIKLDDTHTKPQLLVTFNIESPSLGSTTCYCTSIILNYMGLNQNWPPKLDTWWCLMLKNTRICGPVGLKHTST